MNPNAGDKKAEISDEDLAKLLERRIKRIITVAALTGNEVLILGAFGCGAFHNPPHIVANAFKEALTDTAKYFETIEFAVYHTRYETENYEVFKAVFG